MSGWTQEQLEQMKRALACVVPSYNAGARVRPVVARLCAMLERVIVVDDGSTDGAAQALCDLPVRLLSFPENRGKGHALLAGFAEALREPWVEAVFVLDADGQHDPEELPGLYEVCIERQADLVIGARTFDKKGVPWRSRVGNQVSAAILRRVLGTDLTDTQSGYRVLSRRFAEDVVRSVPGGRYETEMAILLKALGEGRRVMSIPIRTIYESGNPSSHFRRIRDSYRVLWTLLRAILGAKARRASAR
ncbi:MAG TPA: glycosyltransferase family 2 protein [Candidatus Hydrogenedentes bacterium]|nr:glycosyltransferase family 2 protein [Candidatus Hydrogenedentota bacterium]